MMSTVVIAIIIVVVVVIVVTIVVAITIIIVVVVAFTGETSFKLRYLLKQCSLIAMAPYTNE